MLLEIDHVTKAFGGVVATNDVSATFDAGKIYSLIGPNGAGKTTLFNLITGAYVKTETDRLGRAFHGTFTNLCKRDL